MNQLHPVIEQALAPWMPREDPISSALFRLNAAIQRGEEFPDAAHRVAKSVGVDQPTLEKAYDAQFN